jgi:hypothetical protein
MEHWKTAGQQSDRPDLHTQLEELVAAVWHAEENWRFDDRLDLLHGQTGPN